ncbi:MAG: ankyrin repeat domain-containing protein [Bacteroidia bacterium]
MKSIKTLLMLLFAVVSTTLNAQVKDTTRGEAGPTVDPFDLSGENSRGFYGEDDRRDVTDAYGYEDYARATAVMVRMDRIGDDYMDCPSLRDKLSSRYGTSKFHENVSFLDQPACGTCTGFLIAPDILVTAGHCIESMTDCENYAWVFDYTKELLHLDWADYVSLESENVYTCEDIISTELVSGGGDWAVIHLDRKSDRDPYRFRINDKIADYEDVYMIGSPSGLPLKLADDAWVSWNGNDQYFEANLDAFGGNSGGPVFDEAGWIEGILVRGQTDYIYDQECECVKVSVQGNFAYNQESVQRITKVPFDALLEALYNNVEYAIREGDIERLEKWMVYGGLVDHSYVVERGRFENIALEVNNMDALMMILENSESEMSGMMAFAIESKNLEFVKYLLENGTNPNEADEDGNTSIFWAIQHGNTEALKLLLERGANVNVTNNRGETAVFEAIRKYDYSSLRILVDNDVNLFKVDNNGWTARKYAKKRKYKTMKKWLKKAEKGKL